MLKKFFCLLFWCAPLLGFAQDPSSKIEIQVKPTDPKKGLTLELHKAGNEITIRHKRVDSIAKFSFGEEDQATMRRLLSKKGVYFDSLVRDSIAYFQRKVDSLRLAHTYFSIDSATIYKSSHPAYWKYLETILKTPNSALEKKMSDGALIDNTYAFVTIIQNNNERSVYIDSLDAGAYPLLSKLVNDTIAIMKAHKLARERKN